MQFELSHGSFIGGWYLSIRAWTFCKNMPNLVIKVFSSLNNPVKQKPHEEPYFMASCQKNQCHKFVFRKYDKLKH